MKELLISEVPGTQRVSEKIRDSRQLDAECDCDFLSPAFPSAHPARKACETRGSANKSTFV